MIDGWFITTGWAFSRVTLMLHAVNESMDIILGKRNDATPNYSKPPG